MKIRLKEKYFTKCEVQRDILSKKAFPSSIKMCAPPKQQLSGIYKKPKRKNVSVYLNKGSLTVEAALILPFFIMVLLTFFSFFLQYASAAELKIQAAAEAKKVAIAVGSMEYEESGDITIHKSRVLEYVWLMPFQKQSRITQTAVCRAWIGFEKLEIEEVYVYATPEGEVYHLKSDCTHLDLSIRCTTLVSARKNYRECEHCDERFGMLVYVTDEGECYHSERNCSGLKRTIRRIPLNSVEGRSCCIRCMERGN